MCAEERFDVVVAGGGPAGSTAAYCLARAGMNVCLVDKQQFPRPKTCAGLVTWKTIECIRQVYGVDLQALKSLGLVRHALREYRIFFDSTQVAGGRLAFPFHLVDRPHYDHHWLQQSADAGAVVLTGNAVKTLDPVSGRVELDNGRRLRGRCVIGADGAWSRVRQSIFGTRRERLRWRAQLAMTIEKRCAAEKPPQYASLHFGFVPWGYAWSFPGTEDQVVGIGSLRHKDRHSFATGFRAFMKSIGLGGSAAPPWSGHPLPYGNYLTRPGRERVLLTGDACGLADPLLGEGIYYAHRSGELAAKAFVDYTVGNGQLVRRYGRALNRHVIRELRWIKFWRNLLFFGGRYRRYRGLKLFFRLMPQRLEDAVQGRLSFGRLLVP